MDEFISRKTLREAFDNADADVVEEYFDGTCDFGFGRQNILEVINSVPAADVAPVQRWIPVTERLPDPGERVIATDGGFVGELYVNSRGQWQRYNVNDYSLLMALDILLWMPLPKPPMEDPNE